MTKTVKRILELMTSRGLNVHQLEVATELPNGSVRGWVKGKKRKDGEYTPTNPSSESVAKLAKYFNVSADYLLCLSDTPTPLKTADNDEYQTAPLSIEIFLLTQDKQFVNLAKLYKKLTEKHRDEVYNLIRGIAIGVGLDIQHILE